MVPGDQAVCAEEASEICKDEGVNRPAAGSSLVLKAIRRAAVFSSTVGLWHVRRAAVRRAAVRRAVRRRRRGVHEAGQARRERARRRAQRALPAHARPHLGAHVLLRAGRRGRGRHLHGRRALLRRLRMCDLGSMDVRLVSQSETRSPRDREGRMCGCAYARNGIARMKEAGLRVRAYWFVSG